MTDAREAAWEEFQDHAPSILPDGDQNDWVWRELEKAFDVSLKRYDKARAEADQARKFPVHPNDRNIMASVPWSLVAPHDEQAQRNHGGQTLERLAERGGLGLVEMFYVLTNSQFPMASNEWVSKEDAHAYIIERIAADKRQARAEAGPERTKACLKVLQKAAVNAKATLPPKSQTNDLFTMAIREIETLAAQVAEQKGLVEHYQGEARIFAEKMKAAIAERDALRAWLTEENLCTCGTEGSGEVHEGWCIWQNFMTKIGV